jgi:hypothetical protein
VSPGAGSRAGLLLVYVFFSLLAVGFRCGSPIEVSFGQAFTLKPGQQAAISREKLVIRFVSVPEDSRCPKGEQCLVEGKARVTLEISVGGAAPVSVDLGTSEGSREMDVAGFQLTLVSLEPFPVSGRPIRAEDYLATISVQRL